MVENAGKIGVATAFVLADQAVKALMPAEPSTVLGVSFFRVANTGAAFGAFQGYNAALILVSVAVLGGVWWRRDLLPPWSTALILGGGLSNVVDRIVYGHVVDYVSLGWWPVFNIADTMITVGVAYAVVVLAMEEYEQAG